MARLGPLLDPKNPPEKVYVGPFFASFPGNEAHKLFFWGAQNGGFWVGVKKFMLKKFMRFFGPLFFCAKFCRWTLELRKSCPLKPEKVTFESLLGLKSYFRGYFGGDPETHFWVTFELFLILRGFGGFRGAGFSQFQKSASEIFLSGWRGAKNISDTFRIFFRIFRVFQILFRIKLNN